MIAASIVKAFQGAIEPAFIGVYQSECRHARLKLQIVRRAQNIVRREIGCCFQYRVGAFAKTGTKHRMSQIGACFLQRLEAEMDGLITPPERAVLGEDEPHPMRLLRPCPQFSECVSVNEGLSIDETLQIQADDRLASPSAIRRASRIERLSRAAGVQSRNGCGSIPTLPRSNRSASQHARIAASPCV